MERKTLSFDEYSLVKRAAYVRTEWIDADPVSWKATVAGDLACPDAYYDGAWATMEGFNVTSQLSKITTPTLMIAGSCDSLGAANILDSTRLPNASLHVFSRASPYPPRAVPAPWARVVLEFIAHGPANATKLFQNISSTRNQIQAKRISKL